MKKPIKMLLPKCAKCKKTLEPEFTTEKEEGDNSKPKVLMMFGRCEDCKTITMCNLIKNRRYTNTRRLRRFKCRRRKK